MKICLINPPIRLTDMPHHIPYGLAMLAAMAEQEGHQIFFLDANIGRTYGLTIDGIRHELRKDEFDVIGIGGLITTYRYVKQIVPIMRETQPNALLLLGGGILTSMPFEMMRFLPQIDVGVIGEGEYTFVDILDHAYDRRLKGVEGIIYREGKKLHRTKPRPLTKDLDELPYPAWNFLDLERYFQFSSLPLSPECMMSKRRIDVISERGCPFACKFCFHQGMSGRDFGLKGQPVIRFNSPEYVVDMIKTLRLRYAIDFVSFLDENLTSNRKRCLELCDLLEKEDLANTIKWGCLGHVSTVDYELLQRLKDTGCTYISYGGESADQRMLDEINKRQTVEQMQAAIDATKKAMINPIMTFMMGYSSEDCKSILATVEFWIKNNVECVPFFITPYPATELYKENKKKILKQYKNNLEAFVVELDDATKLVANLTRYSDIELLGLQQAMARKDVKRIKAFAKQKGEKINEL